MIPHPFGVAGLIANTAAALLLVRYPPLLDQYTRDGRPIFEWAGAPTTEGKRRSRIATRGYPFAMSLLALGFLLQLLDLLAG
jgi:hypothetical protein